MISFSPKKNIVIISPRKGRRGKKKTCFKVYLSNCDLSLFPGVINRNQTADFIKGEKKGKRGKKKQQQNPKLVK